MRTAPLRTVPRFAAAHFGGDPRPLGAPATRAVTAFMTGPIDDMPAAPVSVMTPATIAREFVVH